MARPRLDTSGSRVRPWTGSTTDRQRLHAISNEIAAQFRSRLTVTSEKAGRRAVTSDVAAEGGIEDAIEESRWILGLEAGWDDESGVPCTKAWHRAVDFLRRQDSVVRARAGVSLLSPVFSPASDGSVDLHWENGSYELLVNVPADEDMPAGFYGDDFGTLKIEGTIDPKATDEGLLLWLTTHQWANGRSSRSRTKILCTTESTEPS